MAVEGQVTGDPADLSARDAARAVATGELRATELVEACLKRVDERDADIEAWAFLDRDKAMAEAEERDRRRQAGMPLGPLHGVPVAVKDIIDTRTMPTENGTPLDAGRRPREDAAVVRRLRNAGAVILGKTVTTEFAYFHPGKTHNPHDPGRTPGGSSSGSAAAVATGMVPLALGSQTNGSVIRPASFCGVFGFKPSFGAIQRTGVLKLSATLDHMGVFARSVEDAALAELLMGPDGADADAGLSPGPLTATMRAEPPLTPVLAFVGTPYWERAEPATQEAFAELRDALGDSIDEVDLPAPFDRAAGWHRGVMAAEMARNLGHYIERGGDRNSEAIREFVAEGRALAATDYLGARDMAGVLRTGLDAIFDRFDAIVTPAAPGEAPEGLGATGDPIFNGLWTFLGVPTITLPLLVGPNELPVAARRPPRQRRPAPAHGALAGGNPERGGRRMNRTIERLIALVALLGLIAFMSVLLIYVAETNLIVIATIGMLFAAYDFWRELFGTKGNEKGD